MGIYAKLKAVKTFTESTQREFSPLPFEGGGGEEIIQNLLLETCHIRVSFYFTLQFKPPCSYGCKTYS